MKLGSEEEQGLRVSEDVILRRIYSETIHPNIILPLPTVETIMGSNKNKYQVSAKNAFPETWYRFRTLSKNVFRKRVKKIAVRCPLLLIALRISSKFLRGQLGVALVSAMNNSELLVILIFTANEPY
jgi:hypothetical protein